MDSGLSENETRKQNKIGQRVLALEARVFLYRHLKDFCFNSDEVQSW